MDQLGGGPGADMCGVTGAFTEVPKTGGLNGVNCLLAAVPKVV